MDRDNLLLTVLGISFFTLVSCGGNGEPDPAPPPSPSFSLTETELTLKIGERKTLILSESTQGYHLVWSSSDKNVVEVTDEGNIHAVRSGTAIITVSDEDESAQCVVTVPPRGTYQLVWKDEFEGTALNTDVWEYFVGTAPNQEEQIYTNDKKNIRVSDGLLIIELRKEENGSYTSARISTRGKKYFAYGKMEAHISVPSGRGTWPAFWMLGNSGPWPACGEIDILEHVGYDPKLVAHSLHTKDYYSGRRLLGVDGQIDNVENVFHTYGIEWIDNDNGSYDIIRFYVDGQKTASKAETIGLQIGGNWPFNAPFYFILNLAWGGTWGGLEGTDETIFDDLDNPVQLKVDWVRVYQYQ